MGIVLAEDDLRALLLGALPPAALAARDGVEVSGDIGRLAELLGHLGSPDPDFAVVTP
ncbi:alkyl sulfatase C-terminal domain-containing protein [Streptomyces sp. NPDC002516]